jgi:helicase
MKVEDLKDFGISKTIIQKLQSLGFAYLTEVQEEAIRKGLFEGKNLVVSAPTNTGKTFIAELAALDASKKGKRAFYLVPLKAIAEEKFEEFQEKYSEWGLRTAITTGERNEYDSNLMEYDLIIATYEKLDALMIRNPNIIKEIGLVVVDELQMIGNEERGVSLEILLTKLCNEEYTPQVIGLSATMPNADEIAEWLNADIVQTEKREVELREGILWMGKEPLNFHGHILEEGDFLYKEFNTGALGTEKGLKIHTFEGLVDRAKKEQIIIFQNTQQESEKLALRIAMHLQPINTVTRWIEHLDAMVESTPSTRNLKRCIMNGVAFHHAGMLPEEKRIVERAFEEGDIRIVVSTLTLGAGVNTPAKTVLINFTKFWDGTRIKKRDYQNMAGRAGRIKYHDDFGRSILLANTEKDFETCWNEYINAKPERVESCIHKKENVESSILNLVASGVCKTIDEIIRFIDDTFFGYTYYKKAFIGFKDAFQESISKQVTGLVDNGLLRKSNGEIAVTELGKRCAEEMVLPSSALLIYRVLKKNTDMIKSFQNLAELLIYLSCCVSDARILYMPRNEQEKKELMTYWEANKFSYFYDPDNEELVLRATKTTQMLLRWIDGVPYSDMRGFAPQGVIRDIGLTASWIVKSMTKIAEPPLFDFSDEIIQKMITLSDRLKYGVRENAIGIMKLGIPAIHRHRAMKLAEAGYDSLDSLIKAEIQDLKNVNGIGDKLSILIKKSIEQFITNEIERKRQYYIRSAEELQRNPNIIKKLYTEIGDNFSKACAELFNEYFSVPCKFIGDISSHEPDCIIETTDGKITVECKRKITEKRFVSANEAEEILGKGSKYNPICYVTIGYPDFSKDAIDNVKASQVTLITINALAKMLIRFWEGKLSKDRIIEIIKSKKHVDDNDIL